MKPHSPEVDPAVTAALRGVFDPCCRDKGISVVDMGLLHRAEIAGGKVRVELLLTSGWCPFAATVLTEIKQAVADMPGVDEAEVEIVWDEAWTTDRLADSARAKLRFLPSPATVADTASYVAAYWPRPQMRRTDDR